MNIFVYSPQHAHTCQKPDVVVLNTYGCKFSVGHSSGRGTTLEGGPSRRPTLLRFNGFQRFWTLEHATAALQAAKLVVSPGRPGFWRALHGEKIVGTLREIDVPRDQHDIAYALQPASARTTKKRQQKGAPSSLAGPQTNDFPNTTPTAVGRAFMALTSPHNAKLFL